MAANGYFQLLHEDGKMWMKVFPPEVDGNMFTVEDVMNYLDMISFPDYDEVAIDQYIKNLEFDSPLLLKEGEIIPESEKCLVSITPMGESAFVRFYPPSTGGA